MTFLSEKRLLELLRKRPLNFNEITRRLGIRKKQRLRLKKALKNLISKGLISKLKNGKFGFEEIRREERVAGFIRKKGRSCFLVEEDKKRRVIPIENPQKGLGEGLLAVGIKKGEACQILRTFESLDSLEEIRDFVRIKYGLPLRFKKSQEREARESIKRDFSLERIDLRKVKHVTIDGEKAKDFDDAVAIEKRDKGFRLYVSIADVAHYVEKDSIVDREAYKRGMSIYFPDSVIPMLPKILSNDLCSLNPKEDRLAFTVILDFTKYGEVEAFDVKKSIIRSVRRLTYEEVERALIERDRKERGRLKGILKDLEMMRELTEILIEKRRERGSLDFDLPEPEFVLDIGGEIRDIMRSKRLFSHRIIEEFMIAANRQIAEFFEKKKIPALFRTHEEPEKDKLKGLEEFLKALNIDTKRNLKGIFRLQEIIREVQGKPYEFIINKLILRSMKQARYEVENKGHFGLGLKSYLHFTSPIRRYPDLICHRILSSILSQNGSPYSEEELYHMAEYLSERERTIMEIEREIEDRIRILFMKKRIGEDFNGIITSIASFGFFVELLDIFVEGVVLFSDLLDDYYDIQPDRISLKGKRKKKIFRIGDTVRVKVISADVERKLLRFSLLKS